MTDTDEIEITPQMAEAGFQVLCSSGIADEYLIEDKGLVERIYRSMRQTAQAGTPHVCIEPLFYVKDQTIFMRPIKTEKGIQLGFAVCDTRPGINPDDVCTILNSAAPG